MPSRVCDLCRRVIPSAEFAAHRRAHLDQANPRRGQHADLRRIRPSILDRDGRACRVCGVTEEELAAREEALEVHHIDGDWRNNAPENLETRCPDCHPRGR